MQVLWTILQGASFPMSVQPRPQPPPPRRWYQFSSPPEPPQPPPQPELDESLFDTWGPSVYLSIMVYATLLAASVYVLIFMLRNRALAMEN